MRFDENAQLDTSNIDDLRGSGGGGGGGLGGRGRRDGRGADLGGRGTAKASGENGLSLPAGPTNLQAGI